MNRKKGEKQGMEKGRRGKMASHILEADC